MIVKPSPRRTLDAFARRGAIAVLFVLIASVPAAYAAPKPAPGIGYADACAKVKLLRGVIQVITAVDDMDRSPPPVSGDLHDAISNLRSAITALNCP